MVGTAPGRSIPLPREHGRERSTSHPEPAEQWDEPLIDSRLLSQFHSPGERSHLRRFSPDAG